MQVAMVPDMVTRRWGNMKQMSRHLPQINVHEKKAMALNDKKQLEHNYV